jgi:hypothetical protein
VNCITPPSRIIENISRQNITFALAFDEMKLSENHMKFLGLKLSFVLVLLLGITFFQSCDKEKDYEEIPYAVVNFRIYPNSTIYWELNSPGGWVYLIANYPSKGVLVYRISLEEFVAFERTCPYDPYELEAQIEVEPSGITAACPSCGTKYILLDGTRFEGPGSRPLKKYRNTYDGNTLHIFN